VRFFFRSLIIFLFFAFELLAQAGLEIGFNINQNQVPKGEDAQIGEMVLKTDSDVVLHYILLSVQVEGANHIPVALGLYENGTMVGNSFDDSGTPSLYYTTGGLIFLDLQSLELKSKEERDFDVIICADAPAKVRVLVKSLAGISLGAFFEKQVNISLPWITCGNYNPADSWVWTGNYVVAPGSRNFWIDIGMDSGSNPARVADIMLYKGDKLNLKPGFYSETRWYDEFRVNEYLGRYLGYGDLMYGSYLGYFLGGLTYVAEEGDVIEIPFGMAVINDEVFPQFQNGTIIVGPDVVKGDADLNEKVTAMDLPAMLDYMYSYVPADTGIHLKKRLSCDLDGDHWVNSIDLYYLREMLYNPYFVPPISSWEEAGIGVSREGGGRLIPVTTPQGTEIYASGDVTNGDILLPLGTEIGSSQDIIRVGEKEGKTLVTFLVSDKSKPLFTVKGDMGQIEGMVNDHIPVEIGSVTTDVQSFSEMPEDFVLSQNYPNPFNPTTSIAYAVPEESRVSLAVYNIVGEEIAVLVDEIKSPGSYKAEFNAENLPSGIYICSMSAGKFMSTRKMMLVK